MRQFAYLASHPASHGECAAVVRESGVAVNALAPLKYLGGYLAASLDTPQRREVLEAHYDRVKRVLPPNVREHLGEGVLVWRKELEGDDPPLSIFLETARFAPMEGELELRFSFRSDLFVLTFVLAPGHLFGSDRQTVLVIGGLQGKFFGREEMREASKLNCEISPAIMLVIAIQVLAEVIQVGELIAVGEADHNAMRHAPDKVKLDYCRFWTDVGGIRRDRHYRLPFELEFKPLSATSASHRRRTKRKREAKSLVRRTIDQRLRELLKPQVSDERPASRESLSALVHT